MTARERLIEKLSDCMDPTNAATFVDEVLAEHDAERQPETRDLTPGCDCDQRNNPDPEYHASDCNWRRKSIQNP